MICSGLGLVIALLLAGSALQHGAYTTINGKPEFSYSDPTNSIFPEAGYYGYVTVNDNGDDLFYWYFPSRSKPAEDPLVVWFTGGPGCSSITAMLFENGPFNLTQDGKPVINQYSWNTKANLLFIDNPIGTGFSHAKRDDIPRFESAVKANIQKFFQRWIALPPFVSLQGRPIFITGESYGGHYVPCIANALMSLNDPKIVVKGAALGNGMVNAASQYVAYANFSLMNSQTLKFAQKDYDELNPQLRICEKLMRVAPKFMVDQSLGFCITQADLTIRNVPNINVYDIRTDCKGDLCYDMTVYTNWLNSPQVMAALAADKPWQDCNYEVNGILAQFDWIIDYSTELNLLLDNGAKVLAYYGEVDWICNWVGGHQWSLDFKWSKQAEFQASSWEEDWQGGAGRRRQTADGSFQFVVIHEAGHMVPMDQPQVALQMLNDFIKP